MKHLSKTLFWLCTALLLGACSTIDSLNPFSSSKVKVKVAELASFEPKVQLRTLWQVRIGSAGIYTLAPAVVGNSVYAAAADGSLARFDGEKQVWRVSTGQPISGGVGADGKLVVVGTAKGEVRAFDAATGKAAWKAQVSSEVLAPPDVADGLVVVRSGDSRISALDAADGKLRWVYQRSVPALLLRSNARVLMAGDTTIAGFPGGKLVAIANNNGASVWEATVALPKGSTELERVTDITSSPVLEGNAVCAVAFQGRIACFDVKNGTGLWSREMSSIAGLDMDSKQVYVTDDKGFVQALDRDTGATVWSLNKLATRSPTRPLALDGLVAVADVQGMVHLLSSDGGVFFGRAKTDGSAIRADPVRYANGILVQTSDGGLFAMSAK